MAFGDVSFSEVREAFGLRLSEADLFQGVPPASLGADFIERLREDVELALAINTEKARPEFMIAPLLSELRRMLRGRFALFSGTSFEVDADRGLNGVCDFLLSRWPIQAELTAPVVVVVVLAKNDNIRTGLGQCVAAVVAAREFNRRRQAEVPSIYSAVTTGAAWKFLRLRDANLTLDVGELLANESPRIVGVLAHILTAA